jgi:DNA-binding XRE family transcriptional regulator
MRIHGRLYKDGKFWLAEVPLLDAMTQGRTRKEALAMVEDLVETLADRPGFSVEVRLNKGDRLEIASPDTRTMVGLMLQRQRQASGLTPAQAAQRLGAKSRDAYARYERGQTAPTLERLSQLLDAVSPGRDFVLQ